MKRFVGILVILVIVSCSLLLPGMVSITQGDAVYEPSAASIHLQYATFDPLIGEPEIASGQGLA
jgi:hypothetical protein